MPAVYMWHITTKQHQCQKFHPRKSSSSDSMKSCVSCSVDMMSSSLKSRLSLSDCSSSCASSSWRGASSFQRMSSSVPSIAFSYAAAFEGFNYDLWIKCFPAVDNPGHVGIQTLCKSCPCVASTPPTLPLAWMVDEWL